jgi:uncharacterized membrane protein YphA (DoxX/SURF4 family)
LSDFAWVCAAIVGTVFVWAGATKLQARDAWAAQARDMGAPSWAIPPIPFVELSLGALLILGWWPPIAASAGIALLIAFSWLIATNLVRGNRPACACFGVRTSRPISWLFVARNAIFVGLLLVALLVA